MVSDVDLHPYKKDSSLSLEGFCSGKSAVWTKVRAVQVDIRLTMG